MKSRPKKASLDDIAVLLERADLALKHTKKTVKKVALCKQCNLNVIYYRSLCGECDAKRKEGLLDAKVGKRWISTNGHEYCYNSEGKPVVYATMRMAELLGRPLQEHETVGRIDGDRTNNADHNLILITKPGINLSELKCECGRHYFVKASGPLGLPQE